MTDSGFRVLNRVLALHGWDVEAATSDHKLATIARQMAHDTGEPLDVCIALVSGLHSTACKFAALKAAS